MKKGDIIVTVYAGLLREYYKIVRFDSENPVVIRTTSYGNPYPKAEESTWDLRKYPIVEEN